MKDWEKRVELALIKIGLGIMLSVLGLILGINLKEEIGWFSSTILNIAFCINGGFLIGTGIYLLKNK